MCRATGFHRAEHPFDDGRGDIGPRGVARIW